ncbi:MAG: hypothetical protein JW820_19115 [Spirochaetales bacterium]|nr:hypothetical protein [Spirochaetales bacterium]
MLQHLPDPRLRLIGRYGLCSSRSRGTWLRTPYLTRLAPEGWRQEHAPQHAVRTCTVNGERVQPQEGSFYGGWITEDIAEPFKGGPGSGG